MSHSHRRDTPHRIDSTYTLPTSDSSEDERQERSRHVKRQPTTMPAKQKAPKKGRSSVTPSITEPLPEVPTIIYYDRKTIDLNSRSETATPDFHFPSSEQHKHPIILLDCLKPATICIAIKSWLIDTLSTEANSAPGILRIDAQVLHQLDNRKPAWLLVAPRIALLEHPSTEPGSEPNTSVLALIRPHDSAVRWFYTLQPIGPLLARLAAQDLITPCREFDPRTAKHANLYTYLKEEFLAAITMPHHQDFRNAEAITDFCPDILDPEDAVARLESEEWLYFNTPKPDEGVSKEDELEPSDDRYLLHLHPAERILASLSRLKCAEYLFVKRNFFRAFFEETYRSEKFALPPPAAASNEGNVSRRDTTRQDTPTVNASQQRVGNTKEKRARVRTEHAHQVWLEKEYGFKSNQAKALVTGWRVLGFLEEVRFAEWVREGGMRGA